jgi:MYXO-CTERM domain-containing protein
VIQSNAGWGLDRIDQAGLPLDGKYNAFGDGAGANVYVFDSGIRPTTTDLAGRILPGVYAIDDGRQVTDCNGHGSHVSGTIAGTLHGVAKKANIIPVRVLDCTGNGTLDGIIAAIDFVVQNKRPVSVANMSLSTPASDALDAAVRGLVNAGVTVVVAAGNNSGDSCAYSPSRVPSVLTVAATAQNDARASFSNFGTCVDIHAPGVGIVSIGIANDTATQTLEGTSMASPHVAGVAAAYLGANPTASPAQVMAAVVAGATRGKVTDLRGSPDGLLNVAFLDTAPPSTTIAAPQNGATVPPSFAVEVATQDTDIVKMELAIDGAVIGSIATAPFRFELQNVARGPHQLAITATDAAGKTSTQMLSVTVSGSSSNPDGTDSPETIGGCSTSRGGNAMWLAFALAGLALVRRRK